MIQSCMDGWNANKVLNVVALVCNGKISGYGTWRWSPDCGKKETVEDRMRALSQLKLTDRRPRDASDAHESEASLPRAAFCTPLTRDTLLGHEQQKKKTRGFIQGWKETSA